ncbi:hypothetical protein BLOT_005191, partial [Blomia tropicalis]
NRFPRRQSLWQAITRNFHGRCLTLTVLICTCMLITFWCQVERINQLIIDLKILEYRLFAFGDENDDACDESLSMLPIICMVMLYIGYLVECWHCTTRLVLVKLPFVDKDWHKIKKRFESMVELYHQFNWIQTCQVMFSQLSIDRKFHLATFI